MAMGLLDECKELFGTSNLYEVLAVDRTASEADVRRGYYKSSLKVHPDRAPDDPEATAKFQTLGKVYAVLNDKDQRGVYDEQGIVDEEADSLDQDRNWEEYWRILFPKITLQDILDFEKTYKGSTEEREDLLRMYTECKGDMTRIMESALCASQDDEPRIRDILEGAVDAGELPALKAFTHESSKKKAMRKRKADKEQKECEKMKEEMGIGENGSLAAMIKSKNSSRESNFNSLLGSLEEKYCKKKPSTSSKKEKK